MAQIEGRNDAFRQFTRGSLKPKRRGIVKFEYPKHVCFRCSRCALCCGDTEAKTRQILLLRAEAERIAEEISKGLNEFAEERNEADPFVYRMRKREGKCVFLRGNLCSIYDIRPIICRFYPFKLENLGRSRYAFSYTDECPGIGEGAHLKRSFFEGLFKEFLGSMNAG